LAKAEELGMDRKRMITGVVSTLAGAISWGASGTCVQYLFAHSAIDSLLLTALRQTGAGIMFLATLLVLQRPQLKAMAADADTRRRLLIFGTAGLFLNSTLYATTISYTNAGTATVLQSLNVPMVLALACLMERRLPRGLEVAALACAALATFLIATGGDPSTLSLPILGLVFGVATAAASVFYTTYPKPLFERWGSLATTGIGMSVAGVSGLAFWFLTRGLSGGFPVLGLDCWVVLDIASFVGTFGAYGLFLHGISIVGPVRGNMLGAAEPVSATVLTALMLNTAFSWADWVGLVLMVATIVLVTLQSAESTS
jgi:drug/metabolite transporter (DMT)-like permease